MTLPFTLHDFQDKALAAALGTYRDGGQRLIVSPTGSGKSYMQAATLAALRDEGLVQTVPTLELSLGIYTKMLGDSSILSYSEARQQAMCEAAGIWTIKRLYNELMQASIPLPKYLSFDEAQHTVDDTHDLVWQMCGNCPSVGWTATAYRGTPAETKRLIDRWGVPFTALTMKDAIQRRIVAMPTFIVVPLMDDETIDIQQGDFVTRQVDALIADKLLDLVETIKTRSFDSATGLWTRATMVCVSSVAAADMLTIALNAAGAPALSVTGETPRAERERTFQACAYDLTHALVQVKVVGEGVDLPFRVQWDLAPTMSPMWMMQRVGRVTRPVPPGESPPVVYVCNHNFTRHAYLWAGLVPSSQVKQAQQAWGPDRKPSRRSLARAIGIEGFGRFTVSGLPLVDGSLLSIYALQTQDGTHQYCVLLHPCKPSPLFFERTNRLTGKTRPFERPDGSIIQVAEKDYGKWRSIKTIPDATGYVSVKPQMLTDKMREWWIDEQTGAKSVGLDPAFKPDARQFMALPVLKNARMRFRVED